MTTFDPSSPLFGIGLLVTAVAFAIAGWGFQASIAGRPLRQPGEVLTPSLGR